MVVQVATVVVVQGVTEAVAGAQGVGEGREGMEEPAHMVRFLEVGSKVRST